MASKTVFRIGHLPITDHLVLGMVKEMQDKGERQYTNFQLETSVTSGWPDLVNRLESGELDGAFMLSPSSMDLFRSGSDIRMLLLGHKTGSVFIKRKGANISSVKDFKGQTVIIPYQMSIHYMLLHRMLVENGLEPHVDVKFETLAPSQMPEALEYGEEDGIGGFIVAEPFGSLSIQAGHGEVFALSKDLWPKHPCCVFVLKEPLISAHPDAVSELVKAFVEAGKLAETDPDKAADIGSRFLKQEKSLIHSILTNPLDRIMTGELLPNLEDFETMQNYMVDRMKVLKGKIDIEKFVDSRFAKEAGAV
jgi:NitT/TauT family transport system substrate-binding protein